MGLSAPQYWWALAACALPLLIHIIGRHRARVVPFAAIEFLLASDLLTSQRFVLKELWLMWLRTGLLAALALAMMQPYVTCSSQRPMVERGAQAAVIVIDDSFASDYRVEGRPLLMRAQAQAKAVIEDMGAEAELAVLTTSAPGAPIELTRNHLLLLAQIARLTPSFAAGDPELAARRAASVLEASRHRHKSLVVISPLAPPLAPPATIDLIALDPRANPAPPNLAITNVARGEGTVATDTGSQTTMAVEATIANFGQQPAVGVGVRLYLNDQFTARGVIDIPPRASATKRFSIGLPSADRAAPIEVRIDDDALAADNHRYMVLRRHEDARVLIVNGAPHLSRYQDEVFFLQTALDAAFHAAIPTQTSADGLAAQNLTSYDVVVLANVAVLSPEQVARLATWIDSGGGLLVTSGNHVDPAAYNRHMAAILPATLGDVADATWSSALEGEQQGASADPGALTLGELDAAHPMFSGMSPKDPALAQTSIRRRILIKGIAAGARALAWASDGVPLLIEQARGYGRIILLATSVDRDWSNLPLQAGFAPWAAALTRYLGRKAVAPDERSVLVGESVLLPNVSANAAASAAGAGSLQVLTPTGQTLTATVVSRGMAVFRDTTRPGTYRVQATEGLDAQPRDDLSFAVNVDPRASDLAHPKLASRRTARADANAQLVTQRQIALAPWLLVLALVLLLAEGLWLWR